MEVVLSIKQRLRVGASAGIYALCMMYYALCVFFVVACTQDNTPTPNTPAPITQYTYHLHMNANAPGFDGQTTRADAAWADGSVVEFKFYIGMKSLGNGIRYTYINGSAVYHAASDTWELTTAEELPVVDDKTLFNNCEARHYVRNEADQTGLLTAVYYGTSNYTHPKGGDIYLTVTLSPTTWRLRFKGEPGTSVALSANIQPNYGATLYVDWIDFSRPKRPAPQQTLLLTVQPDGYTPYIYGCFADEADDHLMTVTTDGEYLRTLSSQSLTVGESGVLPLPTSANFASTGWKRKISNAYYFITGTADAPLIDKSQQFSHSSADIYDDPLFTYEFDGNGGTDDITFTFCDEETMDEATGETFNTRLFGTKGQSADGLSGTFDRHYNLNGNHWFRVDGKAKSYRFQIDMANMTYTITPQYDQPEQPEVRQFTANGVTFSMVRVLGSTFTMGATPEQGSDAQDDEKPAHPVTLSTYYIGQTEVTQELWQAVMSSNPSAFAGSSHPVESVSWNLCQDFIAALNQLTSQQFRLPTEAEWEYAARGGNQSQGYKYAGSNVIGFVAWYADTDGTSTHDVATKQPNELGLYDMSGNVNEWCSDWYGDYTSAAQLNPTGPQTGTFRVYRGGRWSSYAWHCRVSARDSGMPRNGTNILGLRLAMDNTTEKPGKNDNNLPEYSRKK